MKSSTILRDIRLEQGMTICQLADRSGLHRNTVQRVETGGGVSVSNLEAMLAVLGYEIEIMEMEK
jgi:transcriptional regulator with XRE-family HTH domain|tara:strand:+ start:1144 stop:1338 length:195 start_codon:yes stop_codon:yes gene_type:complete